MKRDGAIAWDSPWGKGRPGWHIECSVMSTKYLGNHFDIHGGGIDLAFPHHTNEIAQSEAHTGEQFVNMWLHNGFVTVGDENEKMSKSLGNFVTVHDLLQQIDDPMVLRFFMATTQYRRAIAYSESNMAQAGKNLDHIRTGYRNLQFRLQDALFGDDDCITAQANEYITAFNVAMDDDFNTPNALTAIYGLVDLANQYANAQEVYQQSIQFILDSIATLMGVFGVDGLAQDELLDADIDALIKERDEARAVKNFARSDEIRDLLAQQDIILEDTPQGTRWHR